MNYIEITKEQLLALLFEGEIIGMGTYGIVKEINPTTLAKIYYKEIIDTYLYKDPSKLDKEIERNKSVREILYKEPNSDESDNLEKLEESKLNYLFEIGLLKGILIYNGYKIGVLLNYYKDYAKLTEISKNLSIDKLNFVMERVRERLDDMMQSGIYPRDLKEDNILIRPENLDIVFIDLDDSETRFEQMDYILAYPHIKNGCIKRYKEMKKRVCKR